MNSLAMSVPGFSPLEPQGATRAAIGLILKLIAVDPLMALHIVDTGKGLVAFGASMLPDVGVGQDVRLQIAGTSKHTLAFWASVNALLTLLGAGAGEFGRLGRGARWQ